MTGALPAMAAWSGRVGRAHARERAETLSGQGVGRHTRVKVRQHGAVETNAEVQTGGCEKQGGHDRREAFGGAGQHSVAGGTPTGMNGKFVGRKRAIGDGNVNTGKEVSTADGGRNGSESSSWLSHSTDRG